MVQVDSSCVCIEPMGKIKRWDKASRLEPSVGI